MADFVSQLGGTGWAGVQTHFAVQSLWSNAVAAGAGYCAGAGTDLPTG